MTPSCDSPYHTPAKYISSKPGRGDEEDDDGGDVDEEEESSLRMTSHVWYFSVGGGCSSYFEQGKRPGEISLSS